MSTRTTVSSGKAKQAAPRLPLSQANAPAKPAAAKTRSRKSAPPADLLSQEDRLRFVAEAAYFRAERRGFTEGGELDDWLEAEAEIEARFRAS